jgi:predicted nuclease with TOPRIM domain
VLGSARVKNLPAAWEAPVTDTVLSAYTGDLTQMLSTLSGMSARPSFNLAFSNMQNAMANRYNNEMMVSQQKALDSYDGSLDTELAKLQEQLPKLEEYQVTVNQARSQLLDRLDNLSDIITASATLQVDAASGDPVDATEYNKLVDSLNQQMANLPQIDGTEFGFYGDDGTGNLRLKGAGIGPFVADDDTAKTGATYELGATLNKLNQAINLVNNRVDIISGEVTRIEDRITEIKDHQQASVAEIKTKIAKEAQEKKLQIAMQLQALSVSFEAQQASNEKIVKAQNNDTYQPGSVVNLFS